MISAPASLLHLHNVTIVTATLKFPIIMDICTKQKKMSVMSGDLYPLRNW